ncbi:MAG: hypothetical protein FJ167_05565, partial [Gammaproteobacteria bacterium]|nr:hypothetical protein [Gammaproteobacteria bacterium]
YEWLKNGTPIGGAVGPELIFDAFATTDGANYSVRVYNAVGSVTSPEVRAILPTQTNAIPSLVARAANAPVVTFDGIDPVAGRILRGGITRVAMSTTFPGGGLFYTLDGSEPVVGGNAREYVGPFYLYDSCKIRAVAVDQLIVSQVAAPAVAVEIRALYPVEAFTKGGGAVALGTAAYSGKLYVSNTLVNATATASDGWSLLDWNNRNGIVGTDPNIAIRISAATGLEAVFGTSLTVLAGGNGNGEIERVPDLSMYPYGTEVKLLARPQAGSYLFRWQPQGTAQNPIAVTVNNAGITNSAVFSPLQSGSVSLVADVIGRGQVTQNPLQGQYPVGSAVTLTAVPAEQHRFVRWQGNVQGTNNPLSLNLSTNTSIQAVFEADIRIIHQPAARDVVVGATTLFSVGATGPGTLTYQWRKNGQPLAGETGVVLAVRTAPNSGSSVYDVVVTSGTTSVTSDGAALRAYAPSAVSAWGLNDSGQTNVPAGLTNASVVAAGTTHSLAVNQQGAVLAWGDSSEGKLVVPQALSNVTCIAAGNDFSLAGDRLGRVYAWGRNNFGQLNLPLALRNAVQISAGDSFAVGLNASGEVLAWGRNDSGQTNVPLGLLNVAAVAAGDRHAAALRNDGTVVAWGANNFGQTAIPPGLSNVVAISAGGDFCLALRRDGTVVGWGKNAEGQLTVPTAATNVQAIACGVDHSLALRADGSLLAWGRNDQGQLNFLSKVTNAVAVAANRQFSMAIHRGVTITNDPLILTTSPLLPTATVGAPYLATVIATGGRMPYTWSTNPVPFTQIVGHHGGLPPGLTLNPTSGVISGTPMSPPSSPATYFFGIRVTDRDNRTAETSFSIVLSGGVSGPGITSQPVSQTVSVGGNATFSVTATSTAPLSYQWRFNGTNLIGATNPTLSFTVTDRSFMGAYSVTVANSGGSVTSSPAGL